MRSPVSSRSRAWWTTAFVVWAAVIARMTLWPTLGDEEPFALLDDVLGWAQRTGVPLTFGMVEAFANILLFVPFGALAVLVWRPRHPWWVVAAGCATSCAIELTQLVLLPHRVADVRDVIMNTTGTAVGVVLVRLLARRRAPRTTT
jgi:glycopeptide antibiotics resistance protein